MNLSSVKNPTSARRPYLPAHVTSYRRLHAEAHFLRLHFSCNLQQVTLWKHANGVRSLVSIPLGDRWTPPPPPRTHTHTHTHTHTPSSAHSCQKLKAQKQEDTSPDIKLKWPHPRPRPRLFKAALSYHQVWVMGSKLSCDYPIVTSQVGVSCPTQMYDG